MPAGDADRIRDYATQMIEEARREGDTRKTIRAGDVHDALGLTLAHANVCQVLDGSKFHTQARVNLLRYSGAPSRASSNSYFEFEILPVAGDTTLLRHDELLARMCGQNLKTMPSFDDRQKKDVSESWQEQVFELTPSEFQELAREYLKAKGFADAEIEIVIRMTI